MRRDGAWPGGCDHGGRSGRPAVHRQLVGGAWVVGPHERVDSGAAPAVREQIPLERLLDQVALFPRNEEWLEVLKAVSA